MGLPMAHTCQMRQHLGQTLWKPYLWNRWMDLHHSNFLELSRLVVVEHHCHITFALDFEGQI